ncbi:MAG: hydrogenase maturation protease [Endomicrobiales bacterium]
MTGESRPGEEVLPGAGPRTLIVGLGNTILGDDAVGIVVARGIYEALQKRRARAGVFLAEASCAGWRLVDLLTGYAKVIIVDSIQSGRGAPGECYRVERREIESVHLQSSHGMGLEEALEFSRRSGQEMPEDISIYAIEVENPYEFGETMTPEVERRVPDIIRQIMQEERFLT